MKIYLSALCALSLVLIPSLSELHVLRGPEASARGDQSVPSVPIKTKPVDKPIDKPAEKLEGKVEGKPQAKAVTVPFELLKSGHMAVQVKVNGKGPYRLIFDTGAPITLVNNKLAKEANLLKDTPRPAFTLFGSMGEAKIKTLEIGEQKADDVAAVVMDHPTVELLANKLGPIYGIVGFPFFARFETTVDYQKKMMTFRPSSYRPPDVMKAMMASFLGGGRAGPAVLGSAAQWGLEANKEVGDEEAGVSLTRVTPGSAAATAGLRSGDRLLTVDGRWTDSLEDLYSAASTIPAGRTVVVKVQRAGRELELKVTPRPGL